RLRGRQYYLHLAIPRSLRQHFLSPSGKRRDALWEPLGPDLTAAKPEAAQRVAEYERLFARLRVATMTPDAIRDEIEAIKQRAAGRKAVTDLPMLQSELERIRQEGREEGFKVFDAMERETPAEREAKRNSDRRQVAPEVNAIVKDSDITEGS